MNEININIKINHPPCLKIKNIIDDIDRFEWVWEKDPSKGPLDLAALFARISHAVRDNLNDTINNLLIISDRLKKIKYIYKTTYTNQALNDLENCYIDLNIQLNKTLKDKIIGNEFNLQALHNHSLSLTKIKINALINFAYFSSARNGEIYTNHPDYHAAIQLIQDVKEELLDRISFVQTARKRQEKARELQALAGPSPKRDKPKIPDENGLIW